MKNPFHIKGASDFAEATAKSAGRVIQGHAILAFVRRYYKLGIWVVFLTLLLIYNRYACEEQLRETDRVRKELKDLRYELTSRQSELMKTMLEANIIQKINERGIGLLPSDTTLIEIKTNEPQK